MLTYIKNLYNNNASSTAVTFADGDGANYYAPSVNLMNDGLDSSGNMTNDPYTGNIRYYGASPNNYIYFNCSDYSHQTSDTCEKWRIIGIIDGKVKIVRNESIGKYAFDDDSNDWGTSTVSSMLNEGGSYYT